MFKRLIQITILLTLLFISSGSLQDIDSRQESNGELHKAVVRPTSTMVSAGNNIVKNIPIDSVETISEVDAAILCRTVLGEKAKETGFLLAYRCDDIIEYQNQNYYVMIVSWLVDGYHWSYIGEVMVSKNGDEIYSGAIDREKNYYIVEKLWEK